ncbi:hypothetical protein Pla52o_10020 [Novipirellula galeiformis]|uniref:Uncharacterized protein n=1 Tax=Novipirellula galeiformis TaxID=2528004 RepID=A0A5C6CRM7_9BACT|nr:hypothetical protein Pla52o_10020 [Novipirellula galeiformis]
MLRPCFVPCHPAHMRDVLIHVSETYRGKVKTNDVTSVEASECSE